MSRGPGHIERGIKAAFDAEPSRVFTTEYLCGLVYADTKKIEKKHRVSLVRAAKRVVKREPNWRMTRTKLPGSPFIFFNDNFAECDGSDAGGAPSNAQAAHRRQLKR